MKEAIQRWNIWWEKTDLIGSFVGIERIRLQELLNTLVTGHIQDIIGVRRCGKTVLIYQVIQKLLQQKIEVHNILYLNFDDPALNNLEIAIKHALELHPGITHVFLDEIQNIKEWEKIIRVFYDQKRFQQIFVSGSSASLVSREIGRTLTGRHLTTVLTPFSFQEFLNFHNIEQPFGILQREKIIHFLDMYLKVGGFPETLGNDSYSSKKILVDLYNDILARDIVSRFGAEYEVAKKIGYYLMTNIGTPFSTNSVARAVDLHYDTVKKYIPYYEEVFLLFIIHHFSWKLQEQIKKDQKCYAIDTGLRNAVAFKFSSDLGRLAENAVLVELKRRGKEVFFWKGGKEVDFVTQDGNELTAINVSYTDDIPKREREGLLEFKEKYVNAKCVLITRETEEIEERGVASVPLWKWMISKS